MYLFYKTNLVFLYARSYYPVIGKFSNARKILARPTVFNYIGPLLNPVETKFQVIGTPNKHTQELISASATNKHIMVISNDNGLDEISISGTNYITAVTNNKFKYFTITPNDFGFKRYNLESVLVDNKKDQIRKAKSILKGDTNSPHAKLVLANTAFVLKHIGKARSYKDGVKKAQDIIETGKAYKKYKEYKTLSNTQNILTRITNHKYKEINQIKRIYQPPSISTKGFKKSILEEGLSVIAEIKKASPSTGIIKKDFDPLAVLNRYETNGANAISVVCDKKFFNGGYEILEKVSNNTELPILCKDFIIDEAQIYNARAHGADAILLISSILKPKTIEQFIQISRSLDMDVLVEAHTKTELLSILENTSAEIIGINNRNLNSFQVDITHTNTILNSIPKKFLRNKIFVSESGFINTTKHLSPYISAVLVGTSIINTPTNINNLKHPLIKICGIKTQSIVNTCIDTGVDLIGLNFVKSSHRYIEKVLRIPETIKTVGIFQNNSIKEVIDITKSYNLDYIQLSGDESIDYIKRCPAPVIKGINTPKNAKMYLPYVKYILLESLSPGNGKKIDHNILQKISFPYIISGGLTPDNISKYKNLKNVIGFDAASGIETDHKKDPNKIYQFTKNICH